MTKLISYKGRRFVALCKCVHIPVTITPHTEDVIRWGNSVFSQPRHGCQSCGYNYWIILPKGEKV